MSSNIQMIPLDRLEHHPKNPRKEIGDVQELADSIRESGVLQNLTVVPHYGEVTSQPTGFYWVVIGNRRLEACQLAGLAEAPCVVVDMSPEEQFRTMMVENMQRCDLTPLEEADGFQLMLDMGSTVAQVAQQTGISETKIRSRIKMVKLDRKAAEAGLARGAALADYMELEKLHDPERKNKVLQYIGTENFRQKLKSEIATEEQQERLEKNLADARSACWLREIDSRDLDWHKYTRFAAYMEWDKKTLQKPEDADREEYIFTADRYGITIYKRNNNVQDSQVLRQKHLQETYGDKMAVVMKELENLGNTCRELRRDFIYSFGKFQTYDAEVTRWGIEAMLRGIQPKTESWQSYGNALRIDREPVAKAMKIGYTKKNGDLNQTDLQREMITAPYRLLLLSSYEVLEQAAVEPWIKEYRNDLSASVPKYMRSKSMEKLYRLLAELGYEQSRGEEAYMQGAVMHFVEAKAILDKYKEEMEAWKI